MRRYAVGTLEALVRVCDNASDSDAALLEQAAGALWNCAVQTALRLKDAAPLLRSMLAVGSVALARTAVGQPQRAGRAGRIRSFARTPAAVIPTETAAQRLALSYPAKENTGWDARHAVRSTPQTRRLFSRSAGSACC